MPALHDLDLPPYAPARLLGGPHRMTLAAALLPRGTGPLEARERLEHVVVDADTTVQVRLDGRLDGERGVLLLVHGLTSSSRAPYVRGSAAKAVAAGLGAARLDVRGCGGTAHLSRASYHGGLTADIDALARHLVERHGARRIHVCGFSVGGNMALKWAASLGDAPPPWLSGVTAVSPALDFDVAARALDERAGNALYRHRFLRDLGAIVREREAAFPGSADLASLAGIRTLREFDHRFTAPQAGFDGVDDYYARASARADLDRIRVPTCLLTARDDPLVPFESFADPVLRDSPWLRLLATERGGHVAFLGRGRPASPGGPDRDRFWAENRVVQLALALA